MQINCNIDMSNNDENVISAVYIYCYFRYKLSNVISKK